MNWLKHNKAYFLLIVVLFIGLTFGYGIHANQFTTVLIYKAYQTDNATFIELKPSFKLDIKNGYFSWDNWLIKVE
jgi:hypothetical protein